MTLHTFNHLRTRRDMGFTLIEIVVVLLIFSVVVGMAAVITRGVSAAQKRSLTSTRMTTVDAAIIQFVLQQKRLPCPGNGTLDSNNVNAGLEDRNAGTFVCDSMSNGVIPWRALALSESEATDGWERRFTYRVPQNLTANNALDLSPCDPAGTGPLAAGFCAGSPPCASTALASCTPPATYLANKGLQVRNVAGTVVMDPAGAPPTGAAYVLISHGESGGGGWLNTGKLSTTTTTDGTEEIKNYGNLALAAYYVDDSLSDVAGNTHYDDVVSRPSTLSIATKAGLGPRSH
jgi:prepilin-type N-terminal cleavage/methylation domain-containing protein